MKREGAVWGTILIVLGLVFLVQRLFPEWFAGFSWPWILLGLGGIFLLVGLLLRQGGFMIPAMLLLGIGGILLYQVQSGDWESWAFAWTLIPGFIGLGMLVGGFLDQELARARGGAVFMIALSLLGFGIFGGIGLDLGLMRFWPVLLIGLGLWFVFRGLGRQKDSNSDLTDGVTKHL